mmetsp:Transcript_4703/g.8682  ORF Transcript_4703/g.8682 Transcript_4703/m.8682 type:complete len:110 (+) Transcript_4703:95-424(+)
MKRSAQIPNHCIARLTQFVPRLYHYFKIKRALGQMGYSLGVRDSIMIAHSFKGKEFGPAQSMHGATYTVECEFHCDELQPGVNWVVDIGEALDALQVHFEFEIFSYCDS